MLSGHQLESEKAYRRCSNLRVERGQIAAVVPELVEDHGEGQHGMEAEEEERESNRPNDRLAGEAPDATCTHDDWKQVHEHDQQREDQHQRPLKQGQFVGVWQIKFGVDDHAAKPREQGASNQNHDQTHNHAEFDALLDLWGLESQQGHASAKGQAEHQGDVEAGQSASSNASHPVAEWKVRTQHKLEGFEEHGVVDGPDHVSADDFHVHPDQGHRGSDLECEDLPLLPEVLQVQRASVTTRVGDVRLCFHVSGHVSTPSPASVLGPNPCPASNR